MTYFFYNIFGLNIKSSIKFPELIPKQDIPDIIIHSYGYESLFKNKSLKTKDSNLILFSPDDILYFWDNDPIFRVRFGKEIIINPEANNDMNIITKLILDYGFGTLLMQRGNLVLHASSIRVGDEAIAFIGGCGDGKSTIAAAMNKRDCTPVTDDVLVLEFDKNNRPLVLPSFPRFKLCNDVIKYVNSNSDPLQQIHPEIEKYEFGVSDGFSIHPLPLKTIYVLETSEKNEIIPLKPKEAFMELIKNSYAIYLFGNSERSLNLKQCARLVKSVSIKRLKRIQSLDNLGDVAQLVEKDV